MMQTRLSHTLDEYYKFEIDETNGKAIDAANRTGKMAAFFITELKMKSALNIFMELLGEKEKRRKILRLRVLMS